MSNPIVSVWIGRALSAVAIAFWTLDGAIKLVPLPPVIETLRGLEFNATNNLARGLGLLQLGCMLLYVFPRFSVLGAILLTGYLGGAIAVNLRADNPLFSHVLFGGYVGLVTWAGLLLRDPETRRLLFR